MTVLKNSRYGFQPSFLDVSRGIRETLDPVRLELRRRLLDFSATPNEEFILYKFRDGDDFENLAFRFYRDSSLWWVIADANRGLRFVLDFQAGDVIRIPPPGTLSSKVSTT